MEYRDEVYFVSDFHLGIPGQESSREREKKIVQWLTHITPRARELYLVGDIFDCWHEYSSVVPRGYVRLLGQLAAMSDAGIKIQFITGNHDLWVNNYFQEELGIKVHRNPVLQTIDGATFYIAHGDGLGPGDIVYKMTKVILRNSTCRWLFARLHPNFGLWLMRKFSALSRRRHEDEVIDVTTDPQVNYCEDKIKTTNIDYFVMGHRHYPIEHLLSNKKSLYVNLGDWLTNYTYAMWNGQKLLLERWMTD